MYPEVSKPDSLAGPKLAGDQRAPRQEASRPGSIRVLIVEPDVMVAQAMVGAISERRSVSRDRQHLEDRGLVSPTLRVRAEDVHITHELTTLFDLERHQYCLILCAMEHADGTGIDALAYLNHAHPEVGVLLYGRGVDDALIREAILGGAIDLIEHDDSFLELLPRHLMSAVARLESEEHARRMKRRLSQSLGTMTDKLAHLQSRLDHLETLSITDELTGLYNRRFMNSALDDFWKQARLAEETLGCMVIDIDSFKELNDRFGHQSGDAALYVLGQILRENCRKTDVITRYGGDEFCVLMPAIDLRGALEIARRIDGAFRQAAAALLQGEFDLGLSVGVSITTQSAPKTAMQLIAHADEAMYVAKREGHVVRARGPAGVIAA